MPGLPAHCAWVAAAGGGLHGRRVFYFYAQAKNKSRAKANPTTHLNICRVTIIFISHAAQPALPAARCLCLLLLLLLLISANLRSSSRAAATTTTLAIINDNVLKRFATAPCSLSLSLSLPARTLSQFTLRSLAHVSSLTAVFGTAAALSLSLVLSLMRAPQVFFFAVGCLLFLNC